MFYLNEFEIVQLTTVTPEYQYHLKDHLGNVRVTFTSKEETDIFTATLENNSQATEQATFKNYSRVTADVYDHTDAGTTYDKAQLLNGGHNSQVGLTKSIAVMPGDVVSVEVYAKYFETTGGSGNLSGFAAALLSAFGLPTPAGGEAGTAAAAIQSYGAFIAGGGNSGNSGWPKGWLNILVFDKDFNLVDLAYEQLDAAYVQPAGNPNKLPMQQLSVTKTIKEPGYVYIYLSNEGNVQQDVFSDDLKVTHVKSPIIATSDYYPFGLTFNSYQRENSVDQKYKFQGQEHIDDLGLNWDSFKWRNHQPDIGRFFNIDPLAEKYVHNSPYAFSENKVTSHVELEGLEAENFMSKFKKPSELAVKRPSENAQRQKYGVTVTDSKKSFGELKSSFLEAPQKLLTNSKAEFNSPVDGDGNATEFKEGSYIKIDITGPLNNGYVQVEDITENESSVSASFVTMEGHVEKGEITFQMAVDSDGNLTFSINSKSEVDQGTAKQVEGYSRSQQMESWQEVLTNFVEATDGEEKSREQHVINP